MRPKLQGGLVLDALSRGLPLDHFMMFSSVTSVWGSVMLGPYGAANQALDALAHHRRALGLPGLSVNFGPFGDVGMVSADEQTVLSRMGVGALRAREAFSLLFHLLAGAPAQATVASVDFAKFKPVFEARRRRPLLDDIVVAAESRSTALRDALASAPERERVRLLRTHVEANVARVFGLEPRNAGSLQRGFFEMGLDSLMSVELKRGLAVGLGIDLPSTLAFEYPNVAALTTHLLELLHLAPAQPGAGPAAPNEQQRELEQLGEAELAALLQQELSGSAPESQ
jgi:acyl carrier protein